VLLAVMYTGAFSPSSLARAARSPIEEFRYLVESDSCPLPKTIDGIFKWKGPWGNIRVEYWKDNHEFLFRLVIGVWIYEFPDAEDCYTELRRHLPVIPRIRDYGHTGDWTDY